MNDLKVVYDPESAKLLMDETRKNILKLLKIRPLSINEMSIILEKDVSTIFRHIKKLEERNLVVVASTRKTKNGCEKLYKRTYSNYVLAPELFISENDVLEEEKTYRYNLIKQALNNIGFKIVDENLLEKYFFEIEGRVIEEIAKIEGDLDLNTLHNLETLLFMKLASEQETQSIKALISK